MRVVLYVMLGLLCALFAAIVSNVIFLLWDWFTGIPDPGSAGELVLNAQRLCVFLVFAALAGVLSASSLKLKGKDTMVAGAATGASMAVFLFLSLLLLARYPSSLHHLLSMSLPPYLLSPDVFDYTGAFGDNLSLILTGAWLAMLIQFLLIIAIAAGGAYLTVIGGAGKMQNMLLHKPVTSLAVLALIILLLPTVAAAMATGAGFLAHPTGINYRSTMVFYGDEYATNVSEGSKTLNFELLASPGLRYLNASHPFTVLIDGRDASNQAAATADNLMVTVEPSTGLRASGTSILKIKGILPASRVEIIANFQDGTRKSVFVHQITGRFSGPVGVTQPSG